MDGPATGVLVVLATFPDAATAERITRTLVEEKLAACGNILPTATSIYRWHGKVETTAETVVIYKTAVFEREKFQDRLLELHPYEVAECVFLNVVDGSPAYLNWVRNETLPG
ncbi:MAG TPA: divalent-cation tolerance protein CutA [Chthoniobacterales bacterium]